MVDLAKARVIAVLTRAPSAGGKTRLFAALDRPADPALLEALLLDTLDGVAVPDAVRIAAVEPGRSSDEVRRLLPPDVGVMPQADGSLGERMRAVMAQLFRRGARAVVLVGSDLPELEPDLVRQALALIDDDPDRLVLGPATDGGYYLIGSGGVPDVFDGITWGSAMVLRETMAAAAERGVRVHLLQPLSDIDTPADLDRLAARPMRRGSRTADWVRAQGFGRGRGPALY
jgi:rSAM/selenodomain-associated transferase 1